MQQEIPTTQKENNKPSFSRKPFVFVVIFILAIGFVFLLSKYIFTPYATKLPADFSYSADVISLDNFYNEDTQTFTGDKRSVTTFQYIANGSEGRMLQIQNIFRVRTIEGNPIIEINRDYTVDSYTWQNVQKYSEHNRTISLFGPHLKGKEDTFLYRHVNYDTPIEMKLVGKDSIEGLAVNHYLGKVMVDQTQNLTHLRGVPDEQGISTEGIVELWIEPVTGWLVKYIDNGNAYYYDQKTKERLDPWNAFSNRFTKSSIEDQVAKAKTLRLTVFVITYGLPAIFALLGLLFLGWRNILPRKYSFTGAIVLAIVCLSFTLFLLALQEDDKKIVIGISRWVSLGNEAYDENIQGFKDALTRAGYEEGKDVEYILEVADASAEKQEANAQKFLEKDVDLIFSQTTPGTAILKDAITDIPIVFSIVSYPVEAGLISSNQASKNNLVGTRNWISANDHINNFLQLVPHIKSIGFVHRTNEANSTIQLKEFQDAAATYDISVIEIDGVDLLELTRKLEEAPSVDSIFSACDTLVQGESEETIIAYAKERRIPSFSCNPSGPAKGDLVATTANFYRIGELAGERAALIIQGVTPTALTTETVNIYDLSINNSSIDFLGISIPQEIIIDATKIYD